MLLTVGSRDGYAVLEVRDGGPGFTDADLAVAFERGALSERYRGIRKVGSGLGLAIAAGLTRRMGGTITAGHAPEGGAKFTVYLPRGMGSTRQVGGSRSPQAPPDPDNRPLTPPQTPT